MTEETAAALAARLRTDDALREALGQAPSVSELIRIAGEAGFTLSPDNVTRTGSALELSDADLANVSGGGFTTYGCNTPTQYFVFTHCYP